MPGCWRGWASSPSAWPRRCRARPWRPRASRWRTPPPTAAGVAQDRRNRRRNLVRRILKEAIKAEEAAEAEACKLDIDEQDRRDDLLYELDRRLQEDEAEDIGELPVGEVVARFCRELGIVPDWSWWQAETWAVEESGHPQSPYARAPFTRPPDARPAEADTPAGPKRRGARAAKPDSS